MAWLKDVIQGGMRKIKFLDGRQSASRKTDYQYDSELVQEAWERRIQKLVTSASYCVEHSAERIFILIAFDDAHPSMDLFLQMNGRLIMWTDLDNTAYKQKLYETMIEQTPKLVSRANRVFNQTEAAKIVYSQIQYEFETNTIYSHNVTYNDVEAHLEKQPAFLQWYDDVAEEVEALAVDSRKQVTWGPFDLKSRHKR